MEKEVLKDYSLFEVSWEVCNKVGGIYTVLMTKSNHAKRFFKKNYFLVGPYFKGKSELVFQELEIPDELKDAFDRFNKNGLKAYFGKWLIKSEPNVILIDFENLKNKKNELKAKYWEWYGIDSLNSSYDFDEPLIWATAVGMFLREINFKFIIHAHEWLSGFSLLYLKKLKKVPSVFTTHATMLGRTLSGSGLNLYEILDKINPVDEAYKYKIQAKFLTEKQSAINSVIFTTVSETTAYEAQHFLSRKPDIITENGIDSKLFPTFEENSIKHQNNREIIREFINYFFFPYYTFDLEHTLIYYTVARFEYRNKGIDLIVKALAKLNDELKAMNSKKTIVFFFWLPMAHYGIRSDILQSKIFYRNIKNYVNLAYKSIENKLINHIIEGKELKLKNLFPKEFLENYKKHVKIFKKQGNPPLSTHYLFDENNNILVKELLNNGLDNKQDDKVKVIIYPVYLNGSDGLLDLSYYDALAGSHLGVFPSYYEPWGYTPLESLSTGTPAITSNLSGYGKFMENKRTKSALFIIDRNKSDENSVNELFNVMLKYLKKNHPERVKSRINAMSLIKYCDWNKLYDKYIKAYELAIKKVVENDQ